MTKEQTRRKVYVGALQEISGVGDDEFMSAVVAGKADIKELMRRAGEHVSGELVVLSEDWDERVFCLRLAYVEAGKDDSLVTIVEADSEAGKDLNVSAVFLDVSDVRKLALKALRSAEQAG